MDMHEPLTYSGARMGHALLRKRQDVAVSEARISRLSGHGSPLSAQSLDVRPLTLGVLGVPAAKTHGAH